MERLTLRRPDDWHLHLRDGAALAAVVGDSARRFARAIVMPNLKPAVRTTTQALEYRSRIEAALPRGAKFEPLMTLYLTDDTPPEEIERAKRSGAVFGVKLYPAGATTHSDEGVTRLSRCFHTLEKMQEVGLPLLVHIARHLPESRRFLAPHADVHIPGHGRRRVARHHHHPRPHRPGALLRTARRGVAQARPEGPLGIVLPLLRRGEPEP